MLQERLNYVYILSVENITKTLSYEEAIKKYTAINVEKKVLIQVCQELN
jgi:hypothetical protein